MTATARTVKDIADDITDAMNDVAELLIYPVDHHGRVYDVRFLIPQLSFHLARAGVRWHPELAVIKKRRLPPTPGVLEDAVEWVRPDAPDSIDDELAGATVDDLGRLSTAARAELIRRLGGNPDPVADSTSLDERTPWRVETSIHFDDEESTSGTDR
jgi:hypothetical protein